MPPSGLDYGPETKPSTAMQIHAATAFGTASCFRQLDYAGIFENACACCSDDSGVVVIATEVVLVVVVVEAVMAVVMVVMVMSSSTPEHGSSSV